MFIYLFINLWVSMFIYVYFLCLLLETTTDGEPVASARVVAKKP